MATFHIHQDAEKENPTQRLLKEKTHKSHVLQPSALGGGLAAILKKDMLGGGRSNFATLNSKNSNNAANNGNIASRIIIGGGGGAKTAFREVANNAKCVADENVTANIFAAAAAAAKKSTVVPVVEQFKTFSVYEDHSEDVGGAHHNQQHDAETSDADKENDLQQQRQQQQQRRVTAPAVVDMKSDSLLHKDFAGNEEDYILDTTPMSVSDVLSPMSVDRSHIMNITAGTAHSANSSLDLITDDSTCKSVAELQPLPRNDRERFFEVVEYQRCILDYFRESEKKHRPKPQYMRRQQDINYSMRTILVDWLVEVSEEYNLDTETLYLSVSYIDRFLSHMSVVRSKLQLVGTAAMYIASKYEEIYPPEVGEFVFITDDTYTKAQVLRMEQIILKILAFDLCTPTSNVFINTYAVLTDMPDKVKLLTQYISELSLLEADPYLRFQPSIISSASIALARYLLDYPIWSPELEEVTGYRLADLKEVFLYLCKTHNGAPALPQQAIQEKYKAEKYKKVSTIKTIELTEDQFDALALKYAAIQEESSKELQSSTATTSNENVRRMISLMFN